MGRNIQTVGMSSLRRRCLESLWFGRQCRHLLFRLRKNGRTIGRFCLIVMLTIALVTGGMGSAVAQVSLLLDQSVEATRESLGWNPNRSYPCGRLVCSDVYFYGSFGKVLTVAGPPDSLQPNADETLVGVEERADLVQRTFKGILRTVTSVDTVQTTLNTAEVSWNDLFRRGGPIASHPSTPKIEVGIENSQTVLYIPEQKALGLQKQLVLTVNEYDAIQNGLNKKALASQWRDAMLKAVSQQLWEISFNRQYPVARLGGAIAIGVITLLIICIIDLIRRLLRGLYRRLRRELKALQKQLKASLTVDSESIPDDALEPPHSVEGDGIGDHQQGRDRSGNLSSTLDPSSVNVSTTEAETNGKAKVSTGVASRQDANAKIPWFARFAPIEALLAMPQTVS
ncbi:MAG: hypothetical protein AAFZ49_01830, partial [Cyanobacteria bacterium J06659_2]